MYEHSIRSIRQHPIILALRIAPWIVTSAIVGSLLGWMYSWTVGVIFWITFSTIGIVREYLRWDRSRLEITNQKVTLHIKNGLFSGYELGLHFSQIKDIAYSKNHLFHVATDSGSLFLRSSAGKDGEITADYVPDIVRVYGLINELLSMKPDDRKNVRFDLVEHREAPVHHPSALSSDDIVGEQLSRLLAIKGITDAFILSGEDRKYIFEHEEDRNHGVYESIRRKHVICIAHDAAFRDPDQAIVFRRGSKIIFPAVGFHEISRPNAISGSPGMTIHEYLFAKLKNPDSLDATILVGFD